MALSEIEKLERRYAENPQGLTFAPLAEVHRKNGDVARALELLRPGLTLHPDYIPASIVLGRCYLDLGDMPAAETAFAHVLALDGENVIALKALADITERMLRFEESEQWLRTLLTIDRSNDEARDQLERVEASRRQAETASSAQPTAGEPATVESGGNVAAAGVAAAEPAAEDELLSPAEAPSAISVPPMPEPPPLDPMLAWSSPSHDAHEPMPLILDEPDAGASTAGPPPEGIELEEPVTLEEEVQPLAGLVGRDHAVESEDADLVDEFRVETAEDIVLESSGGSEFQVANAADELLEDRVRSEPPASPRPGYEPALAPEPAGFDSRFDSRSGPGAEAEAANATPDDAERTEWSRAESEPAEHRTIEPAAAAPEPWAPFSPSTAEAPGSEVAPAWTPPVAEPPRQPEPDLVLTESMAELLLQQGHAGEALKVYRHLESRSPGDARVQEKIAQVERAMAQTPTRTAYSVQATHGQSVQAFMRGVLAARPRATVSAASVHGESSRSSPEADPEGAPTRPAHDSLSLSSVFGEESTPTQPAVSAGGGSAGPSGVSYDEFFGAAGGAATTRPGRASDPKSDDLDQFHAWLQNLKR
jgi:tetratricopeptide (TPR) repeat protein